MNTALALKKYRLNKGVSQLDLELAINASTGTISRIENGRINPTKETLFKIAEFLELDFFETSKLLGIETNLNSSIFKKSLEPYLESLSAIFGNTVSPITEFSYSEGENNFIEKCTQTLYKSSKEVKFIGSHDLFRKYYPEKIDKELYIKPRIKNHLPAKIIACATDHTIHAENPGDNLREVKQIKNFNVNLMANINDTSVLIMCINNSPSILEIFDKHLVDLAKTRFNHMWNL